MAGRLQRAFAYFDIFPSSYQFTNNGRYGYKSAFGGILSIIFIILTLYQIIDKSIRFFQEEDFNTSYQVISSDSNVIDFQRIPSFGIITCYVDHFNITKTDKYSSENLKIEYTYETDYLFPYLQTKSVVLKSDKNTCSKEELTNMGVHPFEHQKYLECNCLPNKYIKNLTISNYATSGYNSYIKSSVSLKQEVFDDPMKKAESIKYFRKWGPQVITYYVENSFDTFKKSRSMRELVTFNIVNIVPEVLKSENIYLSPNILTVDNNPFFSGKDIKLTI